MLNHIKNLFSSTTNSQRKKSATRHRALLSVEGLEDRLALDGGLCAWTTGFADAFEDVAQQIREHSSPDVLEMIQQMESQPGGVGGHSGSDPLRIDPKAKVEDTSGQTRPADGGKEEAPISPIPKPDAETIKKLIDKLRRLQDIEPTIEVRFIEISDNFFDRIGVDFDMELGNTAPVDSGFDLQTGLGGKFAESNLAAPIIQLNIPNQVADSSPSETGFGFGNGLPISVAFLSDIEAFHFSRPADERANIMQAPKVATLGSTTNGVVLKVNAEVSADLRLVRLKLEPSVEMFQRERYSSHLQALQGLSDLGEKTAEKESNAETQKSDAPTLSKIPYVSRLFKAQNTANDETTLLILITPTIVVEEE